MKIYIYLLSCLIVACNGPSQHNSTSSIPRTDTTEQKDNRPLPSSIPEIKSTYAITMSKLRNGELDSIVMKYNCDGERSGTISYYLLRGKLRMIKHAYAEYSHHEAVDHYFLQDSALYFAYFKRLSWSFESNAAVEGATKEDITESRFYLIAQKPAKCLEKRYTIHSASADKILPERIPNYPVECKQPKAILATVEELVAFRTSTNKECFDK